jgi:glyoxylase-like metal-dependent hydrolase (beta-lactamase superfamily II)
MFVGDALRTDKHRNLKPPSAAMSLNTEEARNSIRKIATYDFEFLLPGHGPPIMAGASKKVKELAASLN